MTKEINTNRLNELHTIGFKGILDIVLKHKTFRKFPFICSIVVSSLFVGFLVFISSDKIFYVLEATSEIITGVFPSLLGFSLGGYAIVVGFSNNDLIKYSTNPTKHNIYQILSGIFSLSILFQAMATIVSLVIAWCIKINVNSIFKIYPPEFINSSVNALFILILCFTSIYSLFLTPYIITNLFTLSQLNSLHFTLEKLKDSPEE